MVKSPVLAFICVVLLYAGCGTPLIIEHYPNGNVYMEYYNDIKGEKHGHYISYYENGNRRSEGEYAHGLQAGEWKNWYEEGPLLSLGSYDSSGKQTGEWLYYYPSGVIQQINHLIGGSPNGRFVDYFESGKVKRSGSNRNGLMSGADTTYFESGLCESIGMWENGKLHGKSTFYATNGNVILSEYRDDAGPLGYIFMHDTISGDTIEKFIIRWGVLSDTSIEYRDNKPFDIIVAND